LVTPSLVRAPELKNADILANVSSQRIEVNSVSYKRISDKTFEIYRKFATNYLDRV
jgi:hypothetical protein